MVAAEGGWPMKRVTPLLLLGLLLVVVWPVQGQTPSTATDYVNRGIEKVKKGDPNGAIADFTKAIEIDPRYTSAYLNRGIERARKGDRDGAIADYTKAVEIDPLKASGYYNRGNALDHNGHHDRAIADYTKAIEIDSRDTSTYLNPGVPSNKKPDLPHTIPYSTTPAQLH